ncbi:MAG: U32 family peptidase, partial [Clostridiales bacterium]|nr:U32 family peptidase [Clostridiales bacterium]
MNSRHLDLPELLSPAGNRESLEFALAYGADAVYFASTSFGMRAGAANFELEQIEDAVKFVHSKGAKSYLASNIIPRNDDLKGLPDFLERVADTGIDALIVADLGVLSLAKKHAPHTDLHVSTQLGVTNYMTALHLCELGVKRIVLSRELNLNEIHEIRSRIPPEVELECFVHGSMCVSFSGRCLISNYMVG